MAKRVSDWLQKTIDGNIKFRDLLEKYEISFKMAEHLRQLSEYKTCFIFDDSGSMNLKLSDSPLNSNVKQATRWDELNYFAKIAIEVNSVFYPEGKLKIQPFELLIKCIFLIIILFFKEAVFIF